MGHTASSRRSAPSVAAAVGETVVVRAGERIPLDGVVVFGSSAVDQSTITGESVPVGKGHSDQVYAGTVNGQGFLLVEVTRAAPDTVVSRIAQLVKEAQEASPKGHRVLARIESKYSWGVVVSTVAVFGVTRFGMDWTTAHAVHRAIGLMIVASPCAVMLAIMPAVLAAIANAARHGVLVKGGGHMERLAHVDVVAFDKTGTLTSQDLRVSDVLPFMDAGVHDDELLRVAGTLERGSNHPIARAILRRARLDGCSLATPEDVHVTGHGVSARIGTESYHIGDIRHYEIIGAPVSDTMRIALSEKRAGGRFVALVARGERPIGMIVIEESLRVETRQAVQHLRSCGVKQIVLLTGDAAESAREVGDAVGADIVYSDMLPADKVAVLQELAAGGDRVAFVGDGVNDAPALATASVGVAMGGSGTDAALETADIVLMSDDLSRLPYAILLSKKLRRVVRQNLFFAAGVIATLVVATLAAGLPLSVAVIGHEGSTVLVAFNGLRMLREVRVADVAVL